MGQALAETAASLGCSERTLRRYVNGGALRGRRMTPKGLEISREEERYLESHWALLSALTRALRTERDVRLAVLFGSSAVGEDGVDSDVDVLVSHRRTGPLSLAGLASRLGRALGKRAHVVSLEQARTSPSLLADIVKEGRPLLDRDCLWPEVLADGDHIMAGAAREERAIATRAAEAIAQARERLR
jgi:predicted nucleotidyltransferase